MLPALPVTPPTREEALTQVLQAIITVAHIYGETRIPTPLAAAILAAEARLREMSL